MVTVAKTLVIILCMTAVTCGYKPSMTEVQCDEKGVNVTLTHFNTSHYKGIPYVKGYESHKDCISAFIWDSTTHEHKIQFTLDFSDIQFGQSGYSVNKPYSRVCGTVLQNEMPNSFGSFETTLVFPVSVHNMESVDDHVEKLKCTWGEHTLVQDKGKAHTTMTGNVSEKPKLWMGIHNMKGRVITGTNVGDIIEVHIQADPSNTSGMWDILYVTSLAGYNSNGKSHFVFVEDGCIVSDENVEPLKLTYISENNQVAILRLKAFRFLADPVVKFVAHVQMCSSLEAYSSSECKPQCIAKATNLTVKKKPANGASKPMTDLGNTNFKLSVEAVVLVINPTFDQMESMLKTNFEMTQSKPDPTGSDDSGVKSTSMIDSHGSKIVLCLNDGDVAVTGVVLFIVTVAVVLATGTVLFYQVYLRHKNHKLYNFRKESLKEISMASPQHQSKRINSFNDDTPNPIMYSWLSNRLITPPPATGLSEGMAPGGSPVYRAVGGRPQLQFSRKFSGMDLTPLQLEKAKRNLNSK